MDFRVFELLNGALIGRGPLERLAGVVTRATDPLQLAALCLVPRHRH